MKELIHSPYTRLRNGQHSERVIFMSEVVFSLSKVVLLHRRRVLCYITHNLYVSMSLLQLHMLEQLCIVKTSSLHSPPSIRSFHKIMHITLVFLKPVAF